MRVLVTGATGFIGGRLAQALVAQGHQVRVLRRENSKLLMLEHIEVEHVLGDILDREAVDRAVAGCEVVYHGAALATYWRAGRDQIYRINAEGTRTVAEACLHAGVRRLVHTSSVAAIGCRWDGRPADEDTPFDNRAARLPYWDSKRRAEEEVRRAVRQGLDAVIVNPAAVIGAGDHNLVTGSIITEYATRGLPIVTPGGLCMADVDAVVAGHLLAAEHGRTGERYILGGENLSHRRIADIITEVVGRRPPRWTVPAWALPPAAAALDLYNRLNPRPPIMNGDQLRLSRYHIYYDSGKAVHELGFPLMPLQGAVEKAYRWYCDHGYLQPGHKG